jgi:hypothetical protein
MTAALFRFVMLLALMLMPVGMIGAEASAQPVSAEHSMRQVGHCSEQSDQDRAPAHSSKQMHCAMCAALPASDPPAPSAELRPSAPRNIAAVSPFHGIELEIATPPPKRARN